MSARACVLATALTARVLCADMLLRGMRYTKAALLVFGAGAVLGLAVVSARLDAFARVASMTMALGIAALPLTIFADLRRRGMANRAPKAKPRRSAKRGTRKGTPAKRSTRRKR